MYKITDLSLESRNILEQMMMLSRSHSGLSKSLFRRYVKDIEEVGGSFERKMARDVYVKERSWALYNKEWIDYMVDLLQGRTVLEIFSGNGLLAKLMRQRGIDWIATDAKGEEWKDTWKGPFVDVIKMDALSAIQSIQADVVFGSWLPFGKNVDSEVAKITVGRNIPFVFVGEKMGGCTGSLDFWNLSDSSFGSLEIPLWSIRQLILEKKNQLANWPGTEDKTYILIPYQDEEDIVF